MKKTIIFLPLLALAIIGFVACNSNSGSSAATEAAGISADSLVRRGDYLVNTMGCDDCHSTKTFGPQGPQIVMEKRFGGHIAGTPLPKIDTGAAKGWILMSGDLTAAVGPWGISYAANLSSDETGIGNWSEEQFIKALRHGKLKGMDQSRPLLPPMPWQNFAKLTDTDLKAMFAYFKSTKPVSNVVPGPKTWAEMK